MEARQVYCGLWIDARSYKLLDGSLWTAEYRIREDNGPGTTGTVFILRESFKTSPSAIKAAIAAGRKRIDVRKITDIKHGGLLKPLTRRRMRVA
jgi:hypothetical protein